MSKTILNFDNIAVKKCISWIKYPIDLNGVHIGKIVISNKAWYGKKGFKYFIGYKDDDRIKPFFYLFLLSSLFIVDLNYYILS